MTRNVQIGIGILALLAVLLGGYALWRSHRAYPVVGSQANNASSTVQYITVGSTTIAVTGPGKATITEVSPSQAPKEPNYRAPVAFSASVSADVRTQIEANADAIRGRIAKDPTDISQWIALGGLYEMGGDYGNAEKIWMYVTEEWPKDPTAYNNLGDLYLSYLKEYPKAESYYFADIRLKPDDANAYRVLYSLYTNDYKQGTVAAENILKQGIAANPDATDLQVLLARYYKSKGDTADAKTEYDAAVANAQRQGESALAAQIQQEAAAL